MQYRQIVRSSAVVGAFVLLSRVFGLVRDILMARFFGTTLAMSAFTLAFQIPNLFRRLFGEGALSASFIPVFTESLEREDRERSWEMANRVITMAAAVLAAISLLGIAGITVYLAGAVPAPKVALTLDLLRIMLPYAFFICLTALAMAILNSFHHFAVPSATPVLLNLVLIASMLWVCPSLGRTPEKQIYGVAWAVVVAGALQLAGQIPALMRYGYRFRFSLAWRDPRVTRVLGLMGPMMVSSGVTQINLVVGRSLAMWAGTWAPAALAYAEHLIYLPLGLFATALGTVLLPVFSRQAVREKQDEMRATVRQSLQHLMFVMIPAALGMIVLAQPIVRLLFERGAFDAQSTELTARALRFYAPGLIAFSMFKVFAPAFYALKDTLTPVKVGIAAILLNFALNVVCVTTFPPYYEHAGIALGGVVAETVNGATLAWLLHRRIGSPGWGGLLGSGLRILLASCGMAATAFCAHRLGLDALRAAGTGQRTAQLGAVGGAVAAGAAVYAALCLILCRSETRAFLSGWSRRTAASGGAEGER